MPSTSEELTVISRKQLVGWFLVAQLPFRWIWRAIEEAGNIDFIVTRAQDPGWIGTLASMFSEIVRWPEVVVFVVGVGWLGYLHYASALSTVAIPARELESPPLKRPHETR